MFPLDKRVTIVCGHYGTGKTNLSINLALDCSRRGEDVTLVDLDIVNPYFRSADYADLLVEEGVHVVGPNFANTNLDTPSLPGSVRGALEGDGRVIIDVGGDDAGATALGVYSDSVAEAEPEVLYVINRYRSLTTEPEAAVDILHEIETAARIKVDAVVNNSHLKQGTDAQTVLASTGFADAVCKATGLPLKFTTAPRWTYQDLSNKIPNVYPVDIHVRTPWE